MKKCCKCGVEDERLIDAKHYSTLWVGEDLIVEKPKYFCRKCGQQFKKWGRSENHKKATFEYLNMAENQYGLTSATQTYY